MPQATRTPTAWRLALPFLALLPLAAQALSPAEDALLQSISCDALRAHVQFLSSDLLEGRATPSRGLDIAAAYIAAQFAVDGLKPLPDGTYLQKSQWYTLRPDPASVSLTLLWNGHSAAAAPSDIVVGFPKALARTECEAVLVNLASGDVAAQAGQTDLAGKIVLAAGQVGELRRALGQLLRTLRSLEPGRQPVAVVVLDPESPRFFREPALQPADGAASTGPPVIVWQQPELARRFTAAAAPGPARVRLEMGEPVRSEYTLDNVIGILPGSDPELAKTYVLLSGHYDHLGETAAAKDNDHIFNGANDDASGTAEVLELARVFARGTAHPKRTLVFAAWFGEEEGLLGSSWYARHPVEPIEDTVVELNFEQVGRADTPADKHRISLTGMSYSDVADTVEKAAEDTGVELVRDANSNPYFNRSDNASLARAGIPSHTISVMYEYPDYHGLADTWDKLDYRNMALVTRTIALAVYRLAESRQAPKWNPANPEAAKYLEAWRKLHPGALSNIP